MNCPSCGTKAKEGSKYCTNCGQKLTGAGVGERKSRIAAGLLGIFLGWLGIHNFYLGYTGKGMGQLLISVCSCFILSFVSAIWGIIEAVMIFNGDINTDAHGNKLID